jgi:glycerol-3-phosphate dehydrogenase (NAD(P)+)
MQKSSIALLGAGSWATALAKTLAENGHTVHWFVRRPEVRHQIAQQGAHPQYLPGVQLPLAQLRFAETAAQAVATAPDVLIVVPTAHLAYQLQGLTAAHFAGKRVATAIKGLLPQTGLLVCEHITRTYNLPNEQYAAVLGPGHAEEVATQQQTYLTVCSTQAALAAHWQQNLQSDFLRVATSPDVQGAELASALKNVYALATGVALGLGYGDNFVAALVANALAEMGHLLEGAFGPNTARNLAHSVYAGDLLVTAFSPHSRNRRMGQWLGEGRPLPEVLAQTQMVAEGYYVAHLLQTRYAQTAHGMPNAPIVQAVQNLLVHHQPAAQVFQQLAQQLQ